MTNFLPLLCSRFHFWADIYDHCFRATFPGLPVGLFSSPCLRLMLWMHYTLHRKTWKIKMCSLLKRTPQWRSTSEESPQHICLMAFHVHNRYSWVQSHSRSAWWRELHNSDVWGGSRFALILSQKNMKMIENTFCTYDYSGCVISLKCSYHLFCFKNMSHCTQAELSHDSLLTLTTGWDVHDSSKSLETL